MNSLPTVWGSIQTRTTPFEHPKSLSLTPKTPQFNTKNLSVQHQKLLSSTPKTPHFNTKNPSVRPSVFWCGTEGGGSEGFVVWIWGLCGTEGFLVLNREVFGVDLRGFWCGTQGFQGLKRSGSFVWNCCVEPRGVWNWGGPEGTVLIEIQIFGLIILAKRCVFSISFVNFDKLVIEHVNSFR